MKPIDEIKNLCVRCIDEGKEVLQKVFDDRYEGQFENLNPTKYVELEAFTKWKSNCLVLMNLIGRLADPWSQSIRPGSGNEYAVAKMMQGALHSIHDTISAGLLLRIEDLVYAEAFSNLLEQAEHLFQKGYLLAAGVLSRAVLEEKLRNLCEQQGILPNKPRPTMADYYSALHQSGFINTIERKKIEHLASIGNNAAHNKTITKEDIQELLRGVEELLVKYS